jgi:hypothetical protein
MPRRYISKADVRRKQRLAEAIVAPDRCRAVLLLGKCRSVIVADDPGELLKLRAQVWRLHMDRRLSRSETRDQLHTYPAR